MEERIDITINADEILKELEHVDDKIDALEEKAEEVIEDVENASRYSFNQVLGMARASYGLISSVVQAAGGTVSLTLHAAITGGFAMVAILKPLLAATAMTPGMQIQAALGFSSLMLTLTALMAARAKQRQISKKIRNVDMVLNSVSAIIGMINF